MKFLADFEGDLVMPKCGAGHSITWEWIRFSALFSKTTNEITCAEGAELK